MSQQDTDLATVITNISGLTVTPPASMPVTFDQIQDIIHLSAKQQFTTWNKAVSLFPNDKPTRGYVRDTAHSLRYLQFPALANTGTLAGKSWAQMASSAFLKNTNKMKGTLNATLRSPLGTLTNIHALQLAGIATSRCASSAILTHS